MTLKNLPISHSEPLANLIQTHAGHVSSLSLVKGVEHTLMLMAFSAGEGVSEMEYPKDTLYYCLEGELCISTPQASNTVPAGSVIMVPAHTEHAVSGAGDYKLLQISI